MIGIARSSVTGLRWPIALCAMLVVCAVSAAHAEQYDWQTAISFSYLTGDYGTDEDTDIFYVPITVKRYFEKWEASLVVPYVKIDTSGGQTMVDGTAEVIDTESESGSGLGDILVKGKYYLVEQEGKKPFVDLAARVKLPTADEGDGLGTGETDVGFGVEVCYVFQNTYIGFTDLEYTFIGGDYDNRIVFDVGAGYYVSRDTMISAFYEYRTALVSSNDDPQTVMLYANRRFKPGWKGEFLVEFGLSDGAADIGITTGVRHRF